MDEAMPRRREPPRLYQDRQRNQWVILDAGRWHRTGCALEDLAGAEARLKEYLGDKHQPAVGPDPLIADVLNFYAADHVPNIKGAANTGYNISNLSKSSFGLIRVSEITAARCRAYANERSRGGARRDLEVLRAALKYWQQEKGLANVPVIVLPEKGKRRERWLTRSDAARLLRAVWRYREVQKGHQTDKHPRRHLARLILLGLYTGSRPGVLLRLQWNQIDLNAGTMSRLAIGEAEDKRKRAPRVRLGRRILTHLRRWRRLDAEATRWVCHYDGLLVRKVNKSFRNSVALAGLDSEVTPHTLRHTRATWLMQAGVDMWEAAGSLGMTVKTLQEVYGHHHPSWQKKAADADGRERAGNTKPSRSIAEPKYHRN
jgi:integrase